MGNYQIETSAGYNQETRHNLLYGGKLPLSKVVCNNYDVAACLDSAPVVFARSIFYLNKHEKRDLNKNVTRSRKNMFGLNETF